jgi:DNA-binding FadR family transcriptional regulator
MADPLPPRPPYHELRPVQREILLLIWRAQFPSGWCFATVAALRGMTGYPESTIRLALRRLEESRWVYVKRQPGSASLRRAIPDTERRVYG